MSGIVERMWAKVTNFWVFLGCLCVIWTVLIVVGLGVAALVHTYLPAHQ